MPSPSEFDAKRFSQGSSDFDSQRFAKGEMPEQQAFSAQQTREREVAGTQPDTILSVGKLESHALEGIRPRFFDQDIEFELPIQADPDPDRGITDVSLSLTALMRIMPIIGTIAFVDNTLKQYAAVATFTLPGLPTGDAIVITALSQSPLSRPFSPSAVVVNMASVGDTCLLIVDPDDLLNATIYSVAGETWATEAACAI